REDGQFRTLRGVEAANVLADDMVSIVFAWGGAELSGATLFDEYVAPGCGPLEEGEGTPVVMGIVPLTKQDADALGITDRCNNALVLNAVADRVAEHAVDPALRP